MKYKFSDLLFINLYQAGFRYSFSVTGGAVVHLIDSCSRAEIKTIFAHHEQGAAYMAEGYTRVSQKRACCLVTTGPGGTNAITGLASSWTDSVPVVYISGQVRTPYLTYPGSVRQIGSQHLDIVTIVKSITKDAVLLDGDAIVCMEEVIRVINLSTTDRPGPVWIDIPLDLQEKEIEVLTPSGITENEDTSTIGTFNCHELFQLLIESLENSKRPVFVIGFGAHLSNTTQKIVEFARQVGVPVVLTWNTLDSLPSGDEINLGLIGVNGNRSGNLSLFKSDLVIAFGSHLSKQLTGTNIDEFAPGANVLVLDIDSLEIASLPARFEGFQVDLKKLAPYFEEVSLKDSKSLRDRFGDWRELCARIKKLNEYDRFVNPDKTAICQYSFYREFNRHTSAGDIIVIDGGGNTLFSTHQNIEVKHEMRIFTGHGMGAMGSGIPHAVGAAFALIDKGGTQDTNSNKVFCFIGDGSMQFNIQELSVIALHKLPIVIIIINNDGYLAIKNTEDQFFEKRFGVDSTSGLELPNYQEISRGYRIEHRKVTVDDDMHELLAYAKSSKKPLILEVIVHEDTPLIPRLGFRFDKNGVFRKDSIYEMSPELPSNVFKDIIDA